MIETDNINKGKNFMLSAIAGLVAVFLGCIYDIIVTKYPLNINYILAHVSFFIVIIAIARQNQKSYNSYKILLATILFSVFVILKIYFITIIYVVTVLQIAFIFTCLIIIERRFYLFINTLLIVGTLSALAISERPSPYIVITPSVKIFLASIYIQIHLFMMFIYSFGIYPKIKRIMTDLKFTSIGKSTTFLIHEISKPVGRLEGDKAKAIPEILEIQEMIAIAHEIGANEILNSKKSMCNVRAIIDERLNNYHLFLEYYKIHIKNDIPKNFTIASPPKYLNIILDNVIKNAIEATKLLPNENARVIIIKVIDNEFIIENPFTTSIDPSRIFDASASTKIGNIGTGLYLCKSLCDVLKWDLNVFHQKNGNAKTFKLVLRF